MNNVNTWIEAVHAYVNEAKEVLDETYRFASSSPKSQRNVNDVSALLDDIVHAISLAAPTAVQAEPKPVYLIATGEFHGGYETYTRHDSFVPLSEYETLYTTPPAQAEPKFNPEADCEKNHRECEAPSICGACGHCKGA